MCTSPQGEGRVLEAGGDGSQVRAAHDRLQQAGLCKTDMKIYNVKVASNDNQTRNALYSYPCKHRKHRVTSPTFLVQFGRVTLFLAKKRNHSQGTFFTLLHYYKRLRERQRFSSKNVFSSSSSSDFSVVSHLIVCFTRIIFDQSPGFVMRDFVWWRGKVRV